MSYVIRNEHGAFCSVCQSPLSMEEDDFDACDACGGEGIGGDDDEDGGWPEHVTPDEQRASMEQGS